MLKPFQNEFIERFSAGENVVIIHPRNTDLHDTMDALHAVAWGVGRLLTWRWV